VHSPLSCRVRSFPLTSYLGEVSTEKKGDSPREKERGRRGSTGGRGPLKNGCEGERRWKRVLILREEKTVAEK